MEQGGGDGVVGGRVKEGVGRVRRRVEVEVRGCWRVRGRV